MDQEEKQLSGHESLLIIQQMIQTAKQEQKDNGMGWIVWGWLLFSASVLTIISQRMEWGLNIFFFWNVFGMVTFIAMLVETIKAFVLKKQKKVKTYLQVIFSKLNIGFFITLMFIIFTMNVGGGDLSDRVSPMKGFALLTSLYGFWILVYGALLEFRPSVIGAFFTWACAFACLFVTTFEWVMILHALAVLGGYIIPGHIAYKKFQQTTGRKYNQEKSV
jgi:hypothetical protein